MITVTSLCHETTLYRIFSCISQAKEQGYGSYLTNRKGNNIARCTWNPETNSSDWYIGNKNVTKIVQGAYRRFLQSSKGE